MRGTTQDRKGYAYFVLCLSARMLYCIISLYALFFAIAIAIVCCECGRQQPPHGVSRIIEFVCVQDQNTLSGDLEQR